MPNVKRWSDDKLDKELSFARLAKDSNDPHNIQWLETCEREFERRTKKAQS